MEIKIVRLQNGEDIVGTVLQKGYTKDESNFYYEIGSPMTVLLDYNGKYNELVMRHWLPVQISKENSVVLNGKDILCFVEPNEDFREYYENTVEKINNLVKMKRAIERSSSELTDEQIQNIVADYIDGSANGSLLH
jgi:hypothetical protein